MADEFNCPLDDYLIRRSFHHYIVLREEKVFCAVAEKPEDNVHEFLRRLERADPDTFTWAVVHDLCRQESLSVEH